MKGKERGGGSERKGEEGVKGKGRRSERKGEEGILQPSLPASSMSLVLIG